MRPPALRVPDGLVPVGPAGDGKGRQLIFLPQLLEILSTFLRRLPGGLVSLSNLLVLGLRKLRLRTDALCCRFRLQDLLMAAPQWTALKENILAILAGFHKNFPLKRGIPREELKSRLKLTARIFNAAIRLVELQDGGTWLALPGFSIHFTPDQQAKAAALLNEYATSPFAPPTIKESQVEVGEDVFGALVELGELVAVSPEVAFRKLDYELMTKRIRENLLQKGQITAAEVRDLFGTSRKYALALLEHLDAIGITIRDGDFRRLRR